VVEVPALNNTEMQPRLLASGKSHVGTQEKYSNRYGYQFEDYG
jgi:hypothetical protein